MKKLVIYFVQVQKPGGSSQLLLGFAADLIFVGAGGAGRWIVLPVGTACWIGDVAWCGGTGAFWSGAVRSGASWSDSCAGGVG